MSNERIIGAGVRTGVFIKTASPQIVEVLGTTKLDFAVVDAEHAPFDRNMLDLMMMAGRAANLPLLVRVPDKSAATILQVLDLGAHGILAPHVDCVDEARSIVARARYRGGERGYSGSQRSSGYGSLGMKTALDAGDNTVVMCQIESVAGLAAAAEIAALPGVDALFVGRADLALAMGFEDIRAPAVTEATIRIIRTAVAAGKMAALFIPTVAEAQQFIAEGARSFVIGSDQSMLREGASRVAAVSTGERK